MEASPFSFKIKMTQKPGHVTNVKCVCKKKLHC